MDLMDPLAAASALVAAFPWQFRAFVAALCFYHLSEYGIAWAFNLGFWACSCWVIVAYGRCLEREQTDEILLSSLLGFSVSWFVMEPLWILLITVAPCLCNTRFMNWANDRANDVGLDLSMLMG